MKFKMHPLKKEKIFLKKNVLKMKISFYRNNFNGFYFKFLIILFILYF